MCSVDCFPLHQVQLYLTLFSAISNCVETLNKISTFQISHGDANLCLGCCHPKAGSFHIFGSFSYSHVSSCLHILLLGGICIEFYAGLDGASSDRYSHSRSQMYQVSSLAYSHRCWICVLEKNNNVNVLSSDLVKLHQSTINQPEYHIIISYLQIQTFQKCRSLPRWLPWLHHWLLCQFLEYHPLLHYRRVELEEGCFPPSSSAANEI